MKQEIIDKMTQIVESKMESFKQDFYKYDLDVLNTYDGIFIWSIGPNHTHLACLDMAGILEELEKSEVSRFNLMRGGLVSSIEYDIQYAKDTDFYMYRGEDLEVADIDEVLIWIDAAEGLLKDIVIKKYPDEVKYYGARVPIHFSSKEQFFRFLEIARTEEGVRLIALVKRMRSYARYTVDHKVVIGYDSYQKSFSFWEEYSGKGHHLNGGIIYNPATEERESYWSIHT